MNYLRFFKLLIFQVCYTSSVKSLQIVSIFLQNFTAIDDCFSILSCLDLWLSSIQSENFKNFESLCIIIVFNKFNTFFIEFVCLFKISFFKSLVSLIFCSCGFRDFLFITHFPFLFNFVLEIKEFDFKV